MRLDTAALTSDRASIAYADSTSLISLARIGRLNLLSVVAREIRVTRAVWSDVSGDETKPGFHALLLARDAGMFVVVDEGDPAAHFPLGRGESSVLSAAANARAAVIIDERAARAARESSPYLHDSIPSCTGVLGILVRAKELGVLVAVRPVIDELSADGFRMSQRLRRAVLDAVNE